MIDKNKKLAELLGEEYKDNSIVISRSQVCGVNPSGRVWQEVRYHFDWEWIMKVVIYIENLGFEFMIAESRVNISPVSDSSIEKFIIVDTTGSKIEAVHEACVKFAEWYEMQK